MWAWFSEYDTLCSASIGWNNKCPGRLGSKVNTTYTIMEEAHEKLFFSDNVGIAACDSLCSTNRTPPAGLSLKWMRSWHYCWVRVHTDIWRVTGSEYSKLLGTRIIMYEYYVCACLSLTHAMTMTLKSSQFQGSLRKVKGPTQKPLARIFMRDSNV